MPGNKDDNIEMVFRVAERLGNLRDKFVFLGGCATGFLITDAAAPSIRVTKDVDAIVEVGSRLDYLRLQKLLLKKGFRPDVRDGAPICRWLIDSDIVDIMPTDKDILGFSNNWYLPAIENAQRIQIRNSLDIFIVSPPYFLATKIEAFRGRGQGDFMASHDIEDIITVLDGRADIIEEIRNSSNDLKLFLSEEFGAFLKNSDFVDSIPGHLLPDSASQGRFSKLIEQIKTISELYS